MALPNLGANGDLPLGVHLATLSEVTDLFGKGSFQRRIVAKRLRNIHDLVNSTGHLRRFIVFGSFVTSKDEPNDIDIVLIMEDSFELSAVAGETALLFNHLEAQSYFGASIFWTRLSGALGGEQAMVEYWQLRRDGNMRGIVEII